MRAAAPDSPPGTSTTLAKPEQLPWLPVKTHPLPVPSHPGSSERSLYDFVLALPKAGPMRTEELTCASTGSPPCCHTARDTAPCRSPKDAAQPSLSDMAVNNNLWTILHPNRGQRPSPEPSSRGQRDQCPVLPFPTPSQPFYSQGIRYTQGKLQPTTAGTHCCDQADAVL